MIRFDAGVTGSPKDAPEGAWVLGGGTEIPCTCKVHERSKQKSYLQEIKGTKYIFFNTL